jgi:hypothetical protein
MKNNIEDSMRSFLPYLFVYNIYNHVYVYEHIIS